MPLSITTLNPADKKNSNVTVSGGNLTVSSTDPSNGWVRSTRPRYGKLYFEFTATTVANSVVGISRLTSLTYPGADANSFGLYSNGTIGFNGGFISNSTPYTSGTTMCCAVDLINKLVWYRIGAAGFWNNQSAAEPSTGSLGVSIAAYTGVADSYAVVSGDNGYSTTVNFGATAFSGAVPSLYAPWNGADIDFPNSPTDGQVFYANGVPPIWIYNTAKGAWLRNKGTAGPANKIVNPTMQISQQNGNTQGTASGYYMADQWFMSYVNTNESYSGQRVQSTTNKISLNQIKIIAHEFP